MPAASDTPAGSALLERFRPLGIRIAAVGLGVVLFGVSAAVWFSFGEETRDKFTVLQRLTLVAFGLAAAVAGYAMGRSRIDAREDGLLVVNGFRSHHYPWPAVVGATLRAGGPWAIVELDDGSTAAAMGIQGSDGNRAVGQVRRLRAVLRQQTTG
jgi:hypothetical protein